MSKATKRRGGADKSLKRSDKRTKRSSRAKAATEPTRTGREIGLANVLAQAAKSLRESGAQIAPYALETLSAVTSFLTATKTPLDGELGAAAHLAALLKLEDARRAAGALGISQDLVPPIGLDALDTNLAEILRRGARSQALVAATVMFCLHDRAAKAGRSERARQLQEAATAATYNPVLARTLLGRMKDAPILAQQNPGSSEHIFSISIDLVGSTDAKTRIMRLAQGDQRRIDSLNEHIYRKFCNIERSLYEGAVSHHHTSPPIDPVNFFTVKGIGDEIWILCNVSSANVFQVGHRLIDAAIQMAAQSVRFLATEKEEGPTFDPGFDYGKIEPIRSPVKMFIDLLSHASNLGRLRDDALVGAIPRLLRTYHERTPTDLEIATVSRRMMLSSYEPLGWSGFQEYRTDYIGHEVDRFFRTTKSAIPGTVTIGASMAREMHLRFEPVMEAIYAVSTNTGGPLMGGEPLDPVHARIRTLKPEELKGIGYAYDTFTLFTPRLLKCLYVMMESDERNDIQPLPYHDTAALISRNVVDHLVGQIVRPHQE